MQGPAEIDLDGFEVSELTPVEGDAEGGGRRLSRFGSGGRGDDRIRGRGRNRGRRAARDEQQPQEK